MRIRRVGGLISGVIVGALVAHVGSAQKDTGRNPDWDWPTYNRDLAGTRYSPLTQINTTERLDTHPGVVVSTAARAGRCRPRDRQAGQRVRNVSGSDTHRREWRDVSAIGQSRGRARTGDRKRNLALRTTRRTRIVPWCRVPARRRPPAPTHPLYEPEEVDRPSRQHRRSWTSSSATAVTSIWRSPTPECPLIYKNVILMGSNFFGPGERHIGPHLTTSKGEKGDVHAYDARTGREAVGLSHHSAARRSRQRHVGQ